MNRNYTVYCDGASRKDRRGGWGAVIVSGSSRDRGASTQEIYGAGTDTTNNRMELMGAIEALWTLPEKSSVTVVSDSQYVVKGITQYVHAWVPTWRTSEDKPVKNDDLWKELLSAVARHSQVEWQWVKGHSGHVYNERADHLATRAIQEILGGS